MAFDVRTRQALVGYTEGEILAITQTVSWGPFGTTMLCPTTNHMTAQIAKPIRWATSPRHTH